MLVKVCNQVVTPIPLALQTTATKERRVIPINSKEFRYLRFRAIGCSEVAGQNGNHDSFPYGEFENETPGYGYKSFINKRAHCLPEGALILLKDFCYKPIDIMEIGDEVRTHDGGWSKVSKIFEHDIDDKIVKIKAEGVYKSYYTAEHPLWVVKQKIKADAVKVVANLRNNSKKNRLVSQEEQQSSVSSEIGDPEWINAENVSERDLVVLPYPEIERKVNVEIASLDAARFLGFYLAEGSVAGNKGVWGDTLNQCLQFSFHRKETSYIDFICRFAKERNIETTQHIAAASKKFGTDSCVIVNMFSSEYANIASIHCGKLAKYKSLSEDIMKMPKDWQLAFLKAYFEGDACIKEDLGIRGSTASKVLALQIQEMCLSLGIWCNIAEYKQHTPNNSWVKNSYGNPIYVYSFTTHEAELVFPNINFLHKAKNCAVLKTNFGILTPIKLKEYLPYKGKVYNIEVEEQNSYVVNNIAVHNCEHNSGLGYAGSIGDLPDAFLNRFSFEGITLPTEFASARALSWEKLAGKKYASLREQVLSLPNQKDGSIEVLMRIDTNLVKSATIEPKTRALLERIVRMIDTGQRLTCSMGANVKESRCSVCGNLAQFSYQYCEHLKPTRKGGLSIVSANQVRDLLDKDYLRPEWLKHLIASSYDVQEILKGASNKGVAARNIEINHGVSFFELSVVATPAYPDAIALEKLARQQNESSSEWIKRLSSVLTNNEALDLYAELQKRGLISNLCSIS